MVPATLKFPRRPKPKPLAPPVQTLSPYTLQDPTACAEPPMRTVRVWPGVLKVLNRHVDCNHALVELSAVVMLPSFVPFDE
jgi:hypothetical protein